MVLPFLLIHKDLAVVVHKDNVFKVFLFCPFPFNIFFVVFLYPSLVYMLTLLLTPR